MTARQARTASDNPARQPQNLEPGAIWPPPQELRQQGPALRLDRPLRLTVAGNARWLTDAAARAGGCLERAAGRAVLDPAGSTPLIVTSMDGLAIAPELEAVHADEGYVLSINRQRVLLAGRDGAGVFYGVQTLAQLLQSNRGQRLPGVVIRDWPRCRVRGAHVYLPARKDIGFFIDFLDLLARYKYNTLFLEIGGGMQYDRHPEINQGWVRFCQQAYAYDPAKDDNRHGSKSTPTMRELLGLSGSAERHPTGPCALQISRYFYKDSIHPELAGGAWLSKDEVRRLVDEAARRYIEVVPEVQSLSHSYYLCAAHPEIAERADDPWPDTYCPSNPRSYELLFDVMDEVIEVTRPRTIHIGHDELYTLGVCPRCRGKSGHDLLAGDINKIHAYLAGRGIRTAMWGDKLMKLPPRPTGSASAGGSAARRRDPVSGQQWSYPASWKAIHKVPKDLLIMDWYWGLDAKSERYFTDHGFEVVFGNFSPMGFKNWRRRGRVKGVLGAEISSWNAMAAETFGHDRIVNDVVAGGQSLWSGQQVNKQRSSATLARLACAEIDRLTAQDRWLIHNTKGKATPISLAGAATPLPAGLGDVQVKGAQLCTVLGTGPFKLLVKEGAWSKAIVLDAAQRRATVKVDKPAQKLLLLHGSAMDGVYWRPSFYSYHRGPAVLLRYRVTYQDGQHKTFAAHYGREIGPVQGVWPTAPAGYCYRAVPAALNGSCTLFAQEWTNPRPEALIQSITASLGPDATDQGQVIVAAISTVQQH